MNIFQGNFQHENKTIYYKVNVTNHSITLTDDNKNTTTFYNIRSNLKSNPMGHWTTVLKSWCECYPLESQVLENFLIQYEITKLQEKIDNLEQAKNDLNNSLRESVASLTKLQPLVIGDICEIFDSKNTSLGRGTIIDVPFNNIGYFLVELEEKEKQIVCAKRYSLILVKEKSVQDFFDGWKNFKKVE